MGALERLPRDEADDFAPAPIAARRELARRAAGRELAHVFGEPVPPGEARGNVEGFVGFAQVPLGLAGPLRVHGARGEREVYVPMATNEGALVASHARGMSLANAGGGVRAHAVHTGLSQHPVLVYRDLSAARRALGLIAGLRAEFEQALGAITRHGRLVALEPELLGRRVVLRLVFDTADAIGINMAARAADLCSALAAERTGALERYVHGQDVEKRANARALVEGRGRSAFADVTVPRAVLAARARAAPEDLVRILATYRAGFAQLGTQNWLVQAANGLAAVLLACGQDVAYLPECAAGFLDFDVTPEGDLYASVQLPSLLVGTVGGGSQKGTAAECLALLGCAGPGSADAFAEILAAVVLCGDLSLMAAFCAHEFVAAHERLGRNRPAEPRAEGGGERA